jgi:hypothetical protein
MTIEQLERCFKAGVTNVGSKNLDSTFGTQRKMRRAFNVTVVRKFCLDLKEVGVDAAFHGLANSMLAVNSSMCLFRAGLRAFLAFVEPLEETTPKSIYDGLLAASRSMRLEALSRYREEPRQGGLIDLIASMADSMRDADSAEDAFVLSINSLRNHLKKQKKADSGGKSLLLFLEGFRGCH